MPLTREHAATTLDSVFHLLSRPNIHTIDVLPKVVHGEATDELAVVVTVAKKKHLHQLDDDDYPIPKVIEVTVVDAGGDLTTELVGTDVVEGPPIREAALDEKVRPTVGGYMISIVADWLNDATGTLGVNIDYNGALSIVTNNHVIAKNGNVGSWVYQPDPGLVFQNSVATVTGYLPIINYGNPHQVNPVVNEYDFAWANIAQNLAALNIKDIGQPVGTRAPVLHERVRWIGKTTGTVQQATIASITTITTYASGQGRWAWWRNLIDLTGVVPGQPAGQVRQGDSGSALVANDMNIVGLVTFNNAHLNGYGTRFPPH
jgi:trypsin-like peptidase